MTGSDSQWRLSVTRRTFLSVDLLAGLLAFAWAVTVTVRPEIGLQALVSPEAALAFGLLAMGRWYNRNRNGYGGNAHELGSVFMLIAIAPLVPALVVIGAALAIGTVVVMVRRRDPDQVTATQAGLAPGTPTSGTITKALLPLKVQAVKPIRRFEVKAVGDETPEQKLERWKVRWRPAYLKSDGCKKLYWGFNALQVGQDAAAYGGAGVVSGIIDWILTAMPEIKVITDQLNFKFRFKLNRYDIGMLDEDGYLQKVGSNILRIDSWADSLDDPPSVPLPDVSGWIRIWISKDEGGIYEDDDKVVTIVRPVEGLVYAGMPTWQWTWMTYQTQIRKLFRQDQINISLLASRKRAACGDMRWWLVTRNAADEVYK